MSTRSLGSWLGCAPRSGWLRALALTPAALLGACSVYGPATPAGLTGRYIVTVCDADMAGSTLTSPDLGQRDPSARDALTVIGLPVVENPPEPGVSRWTTPFAQIDVSNSALCPPTCVAVTRDGNYAFVVEYRGKAGPDARTVSDLPEGNLVTAIDLRDPLKPAIAATTQVSKEPIAVAVHPDGTLVAVVAQAPRQQIVMLEFRDGAFTGEPTSWPLIGLDNDEARPTSIAWHPSGSALAITLQDRGEVMFYRFKRVEGGGLALAPWGEPVKAGTAPFSGAFTPDGRYFVINDTRWETSKGTYSAGQATGSLGVIRVADLPKDSEAAADTSSPSGTHEMLGAVAVGISPVGLAISSDGKLVAVANLQRSTPAETDANKSQLADARPADARGGSISLLSLSGKGQLANLGEFPVSALPASIAFDAGDKNLCVTQFRSFDPDAVDGELGFWRVRREGSSATLDPLDFYVGVGKGPHGVLIVR